MRGVLQVLPPRTDAPLATVAGLNVTAIPAGTVSVVNTTGPVKLPPRVTEAFSVPLAPCSIGSVAGETAIERLP